MGLFSAIIFGLVQGLTEFLPISSNAHLRITGLLLGSGTDPGAAFTAIIQLGTELAVVLYFGADLARILIRWFLSVIKRIPRNDPDARMGWFIILGSVPIVVLGFIFQRAIETSLRSLWVIAISLVVFGILLGVADRVGAKKRLQRDLTAPHAAIFGGAQALALIPGVSRSGGTITAGLFLGYERAAAARYSFLLALPAVFGSGLFQLVKTIGSTRPEAFTAGETAIATAVSFLVGLAVIHFFMNYLAKRSFLPFVIYRIALGGTLLMLLATGVLQPV